MHLSTLPMIGRMHDDHLYTDRHRDDFLNISEEELSYGLCLRGFYFSLTLRDLIQATVVMTAIPLTLTSICIGTLSEMSSRAKWAMNDKNIPTQKTSSE